MPVCSIPASAWHTFAGLMPEAGPADGDGGEHFPKSEIEMPKGSICRVCGFAGYPKGSMKGSFWLATAIAFLGTLAAPSARAQKAQPNGTLRLADGTEVQLSLLETVSSADARPGEKVHFQVTSEVRVNGVTVIPKGSDALGTVTVAQRKRRLGRAGVLQLSLVSVSLADGEQAPLRATETSVGDSDSDTLTGNVVATASTSFWPVAPALLLMHGEDTTMPEGTRITAYIAGDVVLDPAKFPPPMDYRPTPGTIPATASTAAPAPAAQREVSYPGYVILP